MTQYHCKMCEGRFESVRDWDSTCEVCGRENLEPMRIEPGLFELVDRIENKSAVGAQASPPSKKSVFAAKGPLLLFMLGGIGSGFVVEDGWIAIRKYAYQLGGSHALLLSLFFLGLWHAKTRNTFMGLSYGAWAIACVVAYAVGLVLVRVA